MHEHPQPGRGPIDQARALWISRPGHAVIERQALPAVGAGQARVRALYSGISRGTEALVFQGQVPPGQYQAMRAPFQEGDFPGPVKYGYSSVGIVEQGPASLEGRVVFCLHPHQDRYVVPADALRPLPEGVPAERAVLAANMETAINACWDAAPRVGDRIAVIGAGVVGALVAWLLARHPGVAVQLIDINPDRSGLAAALGVAFAAPAQARGGCDLVIHASASEAGLQQALQLAGEEAEVIELSWFGQRTATLALGEDFHSRRLHLRSSQVGAVAPARRRRWSHARRLDLALDLLRAAELDALIDAESAFDDLPRTLAALAAASGGLCHRVRYPK
ncbi:zinc-dependent alcohol dehydrogenase [Alkalisalibacterium limincola]|uniref:zinc-dependent alcohol dehydrogenase n=1 Tax=Alkalisalibacterium limincola TaxID=2699169 RepID=UPI001C9BFAFF|nr:zinc-binding alcohol dehydrogenase [Alkalisalibacterium limincola]